MSKYILLKSVRAVLPDPGTVVCDILINKNSGIIEKIAPEISINEFDVINNYRGMLVMPGFIDPHVHFRVPGKAEAEDWFTGSLAALSAGVTTVLDMPNNNPAIIDEPSLQKKLGHIEEYSLINYGIFGGLTASNLDFLLNNPKIKAIKVYMASTTGDLLLNNIKNLNFSDKRKVFSFHAEDDKIIKENEQKAGKFTDPYIHSEIRTEEAALKATWEVIDLYNKTLGNFHITHVSTANEIKELESSGISFECAPHHIFCNTNDYSRGGFLWKCNPPLRKPETQRQILLALHHEKIPMIATDHAPHPLGDKICSDRIPASGIPSLEAGTHFVLNELSLGNIRTQYAAKVLSTNAAKRFDIEKRGEIREGNFADLAIVNLTAPWIFSNDSVYSKCGWSPFMNFEFKARVIATFVNGQEYTLTDLKQMRITKIVKYSKNQKINRI